MSKSRGNSVICDLLTLLLIQSETYLAVTADVDVSILPPTSKLKLYAIGGMQSIMTCLDVATIDRPTKSVAVLKTIVSHILHNVLYY